MSTSSGADELGEVDAPIGVFDQDEEDAVIYAARESKSAVKIGYGVGSGGKASGGKARHTGQMSVRVIEAEPIVKSEPGKKSKKESFTNQDLPFPPNEFNLHLNRFRKIFKPRVLAWAAGKDNEDPFGTNSNLDLLGVVVAEWNFTFPELGDVMEDERNRGIVLAV
ncbi:hypothetical protein HWV62_21906, partial [Athelia sp. TMB]